jgi:transmembrane sensor
LKEEPNDIIKELIARSLAEETTPDQEKQLKLWLQSDANNQRYFDEVQKVTQLVDQRYGTAHAKKLSVDVDQEWASFLNQVGYDGTTVDIVESTTRSSGLWVKIAAGLLLLIAATIGINYLLSRNEIVQYQTAGEIKTIQLPDGSTVVLNRFSKLSFDENYSTENRTVMFSGEAFFEVKPNTAQPFIIQLKNAQIEVVGTSFNVLAYDSLEEAEVIVKTGIVKFSSVKSKKEIKIEAGNKATFDERKDELVSNVNDDVNFMSWRTREIAFDEADLQTVIATLNKVYHANIVLSSNVPASCVVTVKFENQSLESVLLVLSSTLNLTYSKKDNSIEITGAGC